MPCEECIKKQEELEKLLGYFKKKLKETKKQRDAEPMNYLVFHREVFILEDAVKRTKDILRNASKGGIK